MALPSQKTVSASAGSVEKQLNRRNALTAASKREVNLMADSFIAFGNDEPEVCDNATLPKRPQTHGQELANFEEVFNMCRDEERPRSRDVLSFATVINKAAITSTSKKCRDAK